MKERAKEGNGREQLNIRVGKTTATNVRLIAAYRRSQTWTQDKIVEACIKVVAGGCENAEAKKMAQQIREVAKQLSLSFNGADCQSSGFELAA